MSPDGHAGTAGRHPAGVAAGPGAAPGIARRLRIGMVAPEFSGAGGMQAVARHLASGLAERHEVIVCTTAPATLAGVEVAAVLGASALGDVAALQRIPVDVWLAQNAAHAAIAPRLTAPMAAYVHGNDFLDPWGIALPPPLQALRQVRGMYRAWRGLRRAWGRHHIQRGIARCAVILANSADTGDRLRQDYRLGGCPVAICSPGVADGFFQPPGTAGEGGGQAAGGPLHLLTVARMDSSQARKNIDGVLRALALPTLALQGAVPPLRYSIVGGGDDRPRLEALRDALGLQDTVTFLGRVSDDELRRLYRTADLFVLTVRPSPRDIEGFGIVYLEANAAGLPALGTRGAAGAAILDGRTGILTEGPEPAAIAAGIRRFVAERQRFDPAAIRAYAEGFRWPACVARVEDALLACRATPGQSGVDNPGQ